MGHRSPSWALPGHRRASTTRWWCRSGSGIYYDRGELFTYFSPGYAAGLVEGGPFGVARRRPSSTRRFATPPTSAITRATFQHAIPPTPTWRNPGAQRWDHRPQAKPPASLNSCPTPMTSSTTARNPFPWAHTTARTSCPTPSTTRLTFNGSRATTSWSRSATWATLAGTR